MTKKKTTKKKAPKTREESLIELLTARAENFATALERISEKVDRKDRAILETTNSLFAEAFRLLNSLEYGFDPKMGGDPILGRRIVEIRALSEAEKEAVGIEEAALHGRPVALEMESGAVLYGLRDEEGNGYGVLEYLTPNNETLQLFAPTKPVTSIWKIAEKKKAEAATKGASK